MQIKEEYYTYSEYKNYVYIKNKIENNKFNYERFKIIIFKKTNNITYYIKTLILTDKYHKNLEFDNIIKNYIDNKI